MNMQDRINVFEMLFEELQDTNSRIDKEQIIKTFEKNYPELKEDWTVILETLDGKYPIGWTFPTTTIYTETENFIDIASIIRFLVDWKNDKGLSIDAQKFAELRVGAVGSFIAPIVNRTLRLGIGKSLLTKSDLTPMLAKKYEGQSLQDDVYVTEKLDGNRCIASHDGNKWNFTSRNGKKMNVDFDMAGLSKSFVYDGEVMSIEQTELSIKRCNAIKDTTFIHCNTQDAQLMFNKTSGLINSHGTKKALVYNIFDIIVAMKYKYRRACLDEMEKTSEDVRIVPVLYKGKDTERINKLLDTICEMGGEGIMLNAQNRMYEHKRTDALLKYKQVQHCDMKVTGVYAGEGKYTDMCGGIHCEMITDDGKIVECRVGSGLSDAQRELWYDSPHEIFGKIVEIAYHEMTQDRNSIGSKYYSLRFPRLIRVRKDKSDTSEY